MEYETLFHGHFKTLVRLAALLGADDAENLAQEAFVRLHARRHTLRDQEAARGYLRTTVVNLVRSRARHLGVARKHARITDTVASSAETEVLDGLADPEIARALAQLGRRQREALVLRFWLGLNERQLADAMGVSVGTVKSHVSRGLDRLRESLAEGTES